MSTNLDEMGKKLHAKLDSGINQLKAAKAHLEDIQKGTETAIQTKLKAAKETLEAKKQDAKARMEEFVESKKGETQAAVAEWKASRDRKKLERRAERAEKYAEACIAVALSSIEESEVAILDAIAARRDADDAL
jgi:hypothetical protein